MSKKSTSKKSKSAEPKQKKIPNKVYEAELFRLQTEIVSGHVIPQVGGVVRHVIPHLSVT